MIFETCTSSAHAHCHRIFKEGKKIQQRKEWTTPITQITHHQIISLSLWSFYCHTFFREINIIFFFFCHIPFWYSFLFVSSFDFTLKIISMTYVIDVYIFFFFISNDKLFEEIFFSLFSHYFFLFFPRYYLLIKKMSNFNFKVIFFMITICFWAIYLFIFYLMTVTSSIFEILVTAIRHECLHIHLLLHNFFFRRISFREFVHSVASF